MKKRRRLIISLSEQKDKWVQEMRAEDYQQEMPEATYIVHLITQEKKRRDEEKDRRGPGRPRKEEAQSVTDYPERMVPHPSQILADKGVTVTVSEAEEIRRIGNKI